MTQGETQMQTQGADGWSLTMFINPKGVGKRMVVDRQKIKTRSDSRRYKVADRLVVKAGRKVRQAGTETRNRQGSKPGGLEKGELHKTGEREKCWLTWKTYRMNWYRETGNTRINTLGGKRDTWRGWRQS
jgi:hypothetical protein